MQSTLRRSPTLEAEAKRKAWRLAFSVSLCAGALGAAGGIISLIARARFWETPQHPPIGQGLHIGVTGFLAGLLVAAALLKLTGVSAYRPRSIFVWLLAGLIYGVTLPFVTGALLPLGAVLVQTASGAEDLAVLLPRLLDAVFAMPWAALAQGFLGLAPALLAGLCLALAAWGADLAACSQNRTLSTYGALGIALLVAAGGLGFTIWGPASLLSRLGWGP
jgi:hypothetical protein